VVDVNHEMVSPGTGPVEVSDLDTDGYNDILVIDQLGNLTVHYQDPLDQDFPFNDTASMESSAANGMVVGKLDLDGKIDVASITSQSLVLNFQLPNRKFLQTVIDLTFSPNDIEVGDFNGDQREDIVLVGDSELLVFFHNPLVPPFYGPADSYWDMTGGDAVQIGEFGGPMGLDIAIASSNELHIFLQKSQGLTYDQTIFLNGSYASSTIGVGDFNEDTLDDIVLLRTSNVTDGSIEIYSQDENGSFAFLQSMENEHFGDDFEVGDLNDDGNSDIAVVSDGGDSSVLLYLQRDRTRSEFSFFGLGEFTTPGGRLALGELNDDPYTDIVLRTQDTTSIFYQDDFPPFSANYIPSRFHFNENTVGDNLIKLDDYIKDDHTQLQYAIIDESDPDLLNAEVDGVYLDFYPKKDWSGKAKFQVAGWDGDLVIHSNKFTVSVNDVPDILSDPVTSGKIGVEYTYQVAVEDTFPADDYVRFVLAWGPEEMEVNPFTGQITWMPEENGEYKVAIIAQDRYGGRAEQSFIVKVGEDEEFPVGIVIGGVSVMAVVLLMGAIMAWNENIKLAFFMLFVPLYTKIKRENILDHFVRGKIYGYILANPGEHYNAIRHVLGLTNGSLAHHLRTLEREGFIKSKRFGIYRRFYPMNMQIPMDEFEVNDVQRTIMGIISKNPGISQKDIASNINLTPPTVNYHIGILNHEGLVHVARNGRRTECYVDL
jgi:predicted transcriptional regulator